MIRSNHDGVIDLRGLIAWWLPYRWGLILVVAFAGYIWGWAEERRFEPVYTAEAVVNVRQWDLQLDRIAERIMAPVVVPTSVLPEVRRISAQAGTREGAMAAVEAQTAAVAQVAAEARAALIPYRDFLRSLGVSEMALQPVEPAVVVVEPPKIVHASKSQPWAVAYALLAAFLTIVAGVLVQLVKAESAAAASEC